MTVPDVVERVGGAMLTVAGGAFGYSLADSLPASLAAGTAPTLLSVPVLSWAGILALLGVAVEWGRIRENIRATNERLTAMSRAQTELKAAVDLQGQTLAVLTQALMAHGVLVPSHSLPFHVRHRDDSGSGL